MGRIVGFALLVSLLGAAAIVALGGVTLSPAQQADHRREAAKPYHVPKDAHPLPAAPRLERVAAPRQGAVGATVTMDRLHFGMRDVVVRVGQSVRWVNRDRVAHKLLADDQQGAGTAASFASNDIPPGGSYRATFAHAGRIRYVCILHPTSMVGYVVVKPR